VKEASRRLFFALWPTAEQQSALLEATKAWVDASAGRGVPSRNLHVTLVFLGSIPGHRLAEIAAAARRVSASEADIGPVSLSFERLEYWRKSQVLCALSAAAPHAAAAERERAAEPVPVAAEGAGKSRTETRAGPVIASVLARKLGSELIASGFTLDLSDLSRPFRLHVTLARKVTRPVQATAITPVRWTIAHFALIESHTRPSGSEYQVLETFSTPPSMAR
jgi:2'-5' RNA ligase